MKKKLRNFAQCNIKIIFGVICTLKHFILSNARQFYLSTGGVMGCRRSEWVNQSPPLRKNETKTNQEWSN